MTDEQNQLSRDEVDRIAEESAKRAVHQTLKELAIDTQDWQEAQKDMQFLRQARKGQEAIKRGMLWGVATALGSGLLWMLWYVATALKPR